MKKNKQKALTIMEILVSLVILSLVFLGLLNLFISGRKYLQHSQSRMAGIELGKTFIDPLQMQVRQSDWGTSTNQLTLGTSIPYPPQSINGITFTATTSDPISAVKDSANNNTTLRRVQTKINWDEN